MSINEAAYKDLKAIADKAGATLVAVSKTKPAETLLELYQLGHRDFGENYVQELVDKRAELPKDIRWHFIGHLQTNKVKYIAPFVHLIHGVDSWKLLSEINRQGLRWKTTINVLLQMHIAREETKFGLSEEELRDVIASLADEPLPNIRVKGMMGMASFTEDKKKIESEFSELKKIYDAHATLKTSNISFGILSMGMSGDYDIALQKGSNMIRIGSKIFGSRSYT